MLILMKKKKKMKTLMIQQFSKKGYKEIKRLNEKLEKKNELLNTQEDLFVLEKEKNLTLEKLLAEEKAKVEKLTVDLSLANDSNKRMSNENTLTNESLAFLKATHSKLQESFTYLSAKFKDLEVNYSALWESTKTNSKATLDSNVSTSKCCSKFYNHDINACKTNLAKLEDLIKAKDKQLDRLNMFVKNGYEGDVKPTPKVAYKEGRHPMIGHGLGHYKGMKVNERKVVKGNEVISFTKSGNLGNMMNIAHGVTTGAPTHDKLKSTSTTTNRHGRVRSATKETKIVVVHEPSPNYTSDYMVTIDHNGKMVVKYVGAYTKKTILRSVWVPKMYASNTQGPKALWVPKV